MSKHNKMNIINHRQDWINSFIPLALELPQNRDACFFHRSRFLKQNVEIVSANFSRSPGAFVVPFTSWSRIWLLKSVRSVSLVYLYLIRFNGRKLNVRINFYRRYIFLFFFAFFGETKNGSRNDRLAQKTHLNRERAFVKYHKVFRASFGFGWGIKILTRSSNWRLLS